MTPDEGGDLEADYRQYRPVLLAVLARLARSGFAVPPSDGLELVHDFFLEVWPDVRRRFDPARGAFQSLLTVAFVRFARARIARDFRMRASRVPIDDLDEIASPSEDASTAAADSLDASAVARAVAGLPEAQRRVLAVRFSASSERAAARTLGVSRHSLREQLLEALGRVAVAMETPGGLGDREWRLARLLWAEERSEADAAAVLAMTPSQLRHSRRRVLEALGAARLESLSSMEDGDDGDDDS